MNELLIVAGAHLLAVMSPGPDLALILKLSLVNNRKTAIYASAGIALGIAVHVTYSLLGIALIISQSILVFNIIKLLGAAYLIWIGIKSLLAKKGPNTSQEKPEQKLSKFVSFKSGLLTNLLNPKATLFFLSLFTQVIGPDTSTLIKAAYGAEMIVATFIWFSLVALLMTKQSVRKKFVNIQHHISRFFGLALIALGLKVAFSSK
jgi:RhtB (resistance to homoserine/threonine) family protein